MKTDYCSYPPKLAADLEIAEQRAAERSVFIVGSAALGRYLLLRGAENRVMSLIDGARGGRRLVYYFLPGFNATSQPFT